ncbi:MAG: hypothetical protein ACKV19_14560 [Verrucomicrobiales bacterium]
MDLLLTDNPFFALIASGYARQRTWHGHCIRVATAEGLMLLKLYALPSLYRQGQIARAGVYESDLVMLLVAHPAEDATLLETLRPHVPECDINALGVVLGDLRARMARKF